MTDSQKRVLEEAFKVLGEIHSNANPPHSDADPAQEWTYSQYAQEGVSLMLELEDILQGDAEMNAQIRGGY